MTVDIMALETKPGMFLKLTASPSPDKFAKAVREGDVNTTCGHMVSLVVSSKGLDNTPLALLGNHMRTALVQLYASKDGKAGK